MICYMVYYVLTYLTWLNRHLLPEKNIGIFFYSSHFYSCTCVNSLNERLGWKLNKNLVFFFSIYFTNLTDMLCCFPACFEYSPCFFLRLGHPNNIESRRSRIALCFSFVVVLFLFYAAINSFPLIRHFILALSFSGGISCFVIEIYTEGFSPFIQPNCLSFLVTLQE